MKKAAIYALGIAAITLASCGKKDAASMRELDGTWKMTSGSISNTSIEKNTESDGTDNYQSKSEYTSNTEISGGTASTSYTNVYYSDSGVITTNSGESTAEKEIEITFDKKAGTYEKVETSTEEMEESIGYEGRTASFGKSVQIIEIEKTEKGTFYINEKSGDNKAGTIIVFVPESIVSEKTDEKTDTYTADYYSSYYEYENAQDTPDFYLPEYEAGEVIVTTKKEVSEIEVDGDNNSSYIANVVTSTKKEMEIDMNYKLTSENVVTETKTGKRTSTRSYDTEEEYTYSLSFEKQ